MSTQMFVEEPQTSLIGAASLPEQGAASWIDYGAMQSRITYVVRNIATFLGLYVLVNQG